MCDSAEAGGRFPDSRRPACVGSGFLLNVVFNGFTHILPLEIGGFMAEFLTFAICSLSSVGCSF